MIDPDKSLDRHRRRFNIFFSINIVLIVAVLALTTLAIVALAQNPESIGAFFGRIASGFNSTNK
jgi:hypothetical protein